jgi:anti-anti-sigma factor
MSTVIRKQPDRYDLSGRLTLSSAMQFREDAAQEIPADQSVTGDLSDVEVDGSAALALLVHLVRRSRSAGGDIRFVNASGRLIRMAEMAGLEQLLALEG